MVYLKMTRKEGQDRIVGTQQREALLRMIFKELWIIRVLLIVQITLDEGQTASLIREGQVQEIPLRKEELRLTRRSFSPPVYLARRDKKHTRYHLTRRMR